MTQLLSSIADWMGSLSCLFGYPWHINRRILADPLILYSGKSSHDTEGGLPWGLPSCTCFARNSWSKTSCFTWGLIQHNPLVSSGWTNGRLKDAGPMSRQLRKIVLYNHWMLEISSKSLWLKKTAMAANDLSPNRLIISNQSLQRGMILKRYS